VRFVGGTRALSSSIYNLYARTTGAGARDPASNGQNNDEAGFPLHRLQSDEAWNYYAGDGDIVLYEFDLASGVVRAIHVGVGGASSVPQYTVPGLTWVGALLDTGATWALTGSANTPAFDARDSEMAAGNATVVEELYRRFPAHHDLIRRLLGF
jgi:predicted cupin superfamily sugar epimerase